MVAGKEEIFMKNAIMVISDVHAYLDTEGTVWLNAEDVARGLGFTQIQNKNGKIYTSIRWKTVNRYLIEFNFPQQVGEKSFIPENMFYRLAMKAKNEAAEKFQAKVADEILPSIRKHGMYATDETIDKIIDNPDFGIKLLQALKAERAKNTELQNTVETQAVQIAEMTPKVSYYDLILQSNEALPISVIAKDYGYSAKTMNKLLHNMKIQYRLLSGSWLVYQNYAQEGYTCTKTFALANGNSRTHTYWTQKGRIFLYNELKKRGVLPLIERFN